MKLKSLNRFLLFALALAATVYLIGAKSIQTFTKFAQTEVVDNYKYSCVHSDAQADQPFEAEDKEEQPETEDNESNESGLVAPTFDSSLLGLHTELTTSGGESVVSKSQAEYHTPGYVRLRAILI